MSTAAKRLPKLRKIDVRVPVLLEQGAGWETPLLDALDRLLVRRIDGVATVHELAIGVGRRDEVVARALERLARQQVVALREPVKGPAASPPKRIDSGVRPAMKTIPTDPAELLALDVAPSEPPPFDDAPPEGDRVTLAGIGPEKAARAR